MSALTGPTRCDPQATVTNKVMDTGESTTNAVKTNRAGKAGSLRLNLW